MRDPSAPKPGHSTIASPDLKAVIRLLCLNRKKWTTLSILEDLVRRSDARPMGPAQTRRQMMRVVAFVKATEDSEQGALPSAELIEAMGKYNEELINAGIMVGGDGLKPSSQGKRIAFDGPNRTVIDGPFAETRELVAGFWIWEVKDMDEALAWAKRCPNPMPGPSELELRPVVSMEDFAETMTPEGAEIHSRNEQRLAGQ
jgi:hypothetical protein